MNTATFKTVPYFEEYGAIMQFNKNKDKYIHGWYPFVEGYSKDFIRSIVNELDYIPQHCLEPFSGSGTTPLELQKLGIKCSSFEVSPFMYSLSRAKMVTDYTAHTFNKHLKMIKQELNRVPEDIIDILPPPNFRTIVEKDGLKKWNFHREVMEGLLDIKYVLSNIRFKRYRNLFNIALASILLDVSNMYRNGKCLSYKKNWFDRNRYSRQEIHKIYLDKLEKVFLPDIKKMNKYKLENELKSNHENCTFGDVRSNLAQAPDDEFDLVITSPPYLNSRDYTDTYMIELRMLDLVHDLKDLRTLRKNTFRSHVQINWDFVEPVNSPTLFEAINQISEYEQQFWNDSILNMIKGYFEDMNTLFALFNQKIKTGGRVYFNVANSAYYGIEIKTDQIVSEIAKMNGFKVHEIRHARKINPSSQQKESIQYLIESVIVMEKA